MSHLNNVFNESNNASNLGQGESFPTLGQNGQQQQQAPQVPSYQEAFPTFWGQCDANLQQQYTAMSQDQQQAYYGQWYQTYVPWFQQTYCQPQQPVYQQPASSSTAFTPDAAGASEWRPDGVFAATEEEFPDLGSIGDTKKSKKKEPTKPVVAQPTAEELKTQHKGKPSTFFDLPSDGKPNGAQMGFIYEFYPEYGGESNYRQLFCVFKTSAELWENQNKAYSKPNKKAKKVQQEYDQEDTDSDTGVGSGFGAPKIAGKKGGKAADKVAAAKKKADAEAKAAKIIAMQSDEKKMKRQEEQKQVKAKDVKVVASAEITKVDESRQPVSMVFIGHVDAGKSTICGQLMFQMGAVDERQIEAFKIEAKKQGRDSWWLAYCMDNSDEEKAKGKTVEMGRAFFDTPTKQFTIFDAPGHKNYVPNMIMGACLADYGGLVVSARKGEFEAGFEQAGQTREHVHLAKSLGIQKLIIVVNKMDEPSVNWSEKRFNEVQENITPFLIQTGFKQEDIVYVPISGITGDGMKNKVDPEICDWYKGPTFIDILEKLPLPAGRSADGPLRIPVLDKLQLENARTIYGKVESGTVRLGDKCFMSPSEHPCQVGTIKDSQYREVEYARPGENVQITLLNVSEDSQCNKGDVLCHREQAIPTAEVVEAEMELLELLPYKPVLSRGYSCVMHMHTYADDCTIKEILVSHEKDSAGTVIEKIKPQYCRSFAKTKVRIVFKKPVPMEKYETLPQLGRFTLRDEGRTIALGQILKYKPANGAGAAAASGLVRPTQSAIIKDGKSKAEDIVFDPETGATTKAGAVMEEIKEE